MNRADRFNKIGMNYFEKRELYSALECFEFALKLGIDPGTNANERWCCWMLMGDFERAWRVSDQVGASFDHRSFEAKSQKRGAVVIRCLRGLGDAIQFLRYAPMLKQEVSRLIVQGPDRLMPLLRGLPAVDEAIGWGDRSIDARVVECSDLPYLFRTELGSIPDELSIPLDSTCDKVTSHCSPLSVGVAWRAGIWNPGRSIPPALLGSWRNIRGVQFFSLQRFEEAESISGKRVPETFTCTEREGGNILDTAQTLMNMDLVITVDTMIAHLAGSLRKPVWVMLPFAADWRWMMGRNDSPWYRSMRLFRQTSPGDWAGVLMEVATELSTFQDSGLRITALAEQAC